VRVLLDTNVVISALLFGGAARTLLRRLSNPPFELWTSRPLLRELAAALSHAKLSRAVARTGLDTETLTQAYASQAFVVPEAALHPANFAADPRDAPVVAAALAAKVDWLVTGDSHLLDAREILPCEVLTIAHAQERASKLV